MNWTDVIMILAIVFAVMCLFGIVACFLGRRFCRPGAWPDRRLSSRGFGCCGWPDPRDDRRPGDGASRGARD